MDGTAHPIRRISKGLAALVLAGAVGGGACGLPGDPVRAVIEMTAPDQADAIATAVEAAGGRVVRRYMILPYLAVEADGAVLARLLKTPGVAAIRPDRSSGGPDAQDNKGERR